MNKLHGSYSWLVHIAYKKNFDMNVNVNSNLPLRHTMFHKNIWKKLRYDINLQPDLLRTKVI